MDEHKIVKEALIKYYEGKGVSGKRVTQDDIDTLVKGETVKKDSEVITPKMVIHELEKMIELLRKELNRHGQCPHCKNPIAIYIARGEKSK